MNTGSRISELRRKAGLSQDGLAEKLFVSRSLVQKWENGTRMPDARSLEGLSALFGVPAGEIVERDSCVLDELSTCIPAGAEIDSGQLPGIIEEFLLSLKDADRIVFVRRYHFFDRPSEIAERFGLGKGQVRVILHRARRKLRSFIAGRKEDKL